MDPQIELEVHALRKCLRMKGTWRVVVGLLFFWLLVLLYMSTTLYQSSDINERTERQLAKALMELDALKKQNQDLQNLASELRWQLSRSHARDIRLAADRGERQLPPAPKRDAGAVTAPRAAGLPDQAAGPQTKCAVNFLPSLENLLRKAYHGNEHYAPNAQIAINNEPDLAHEYVRRKVDNGVRELWFYIKTEFTKLKDTLQGNNAALAKLSAVQESASDQMKVIHTDVWNMSRLGNLDTWREKEARELSDIVQNRIHYLQNPADCSKARKLVCHLNKGCGYGCQLHHMVYCFIIAYGTQRTMILESRGWRYANGGWEKVFLPLSQTCTDRTGATSRGWGPCDPQTTCRKHGSCHKRALMCLHTDTLPSCPFCLPTKHSPMLSRGGDGPRISPHRPSDSGRNPLTAMEAIENVQVVELPIVDSLHPRPPYMPLAIPRDLAPRMMRLHGNPIVWWVGQFLKYALKPQAALRNDMQETQKRLGFMSPIVGVHVRRTDKVGTEAAFHGIDEYMWHVDDYYNEMEKRQRVDKRRVYLATDDPNLLGEAKAKFPTYEFISDNGFSQSAGLGTRYTDSSLRGIILDIHFLSLSDYLVCTFSSQVCRVAYEIMQTLHPDAADRFHSLDDIYYYGGQSPHNVRALYEHMAKSPSEIDMQPGDTLGIAGNHWDGYSKGQNKRTGRTGLFPSYKTEDNVEIVDFPTYPEADKLRQR